VSPPDAPHSLAARRHREATLALEQQRRRTLASAVALLVTLAIWAVSLALHERFGALALASHPRALAPLLALALVGAFPAGMLVRRWMLA